MRTATWLAAGLLILAGCIQIDTTIKLERDGSATVTERLHVSKVLLDLDGQRGGKTESFAALLSRKDALRRMKKMGTGIRLVDHEVRPAEGGARESVAVYKIDDLNDLVYMSPLLAVREYPGMNRVAFKLEPILKSSRYNIGRAGQVRVRVLGLTRSGKTVDGIRGPRRKHGEPAPIGPSPRELQAYRDVAPIFRDVLKDFFVRLRFETYCPVEQALFGMRGRMANVRHVDLISFSADDLDRFGGKCVDNQEIMIDVLRRDLGSEDVFATARAFPGNATVPVFLTIGSERYWNDRKNLWIHFKPSRELFDAFFKGKMLDHSARRQESRRAKFSEIGWQGDQESAP
ncbi:MAG: hypothetical protein R6V58_16270 [Planctomycetota bacterium]